MRLFSGFVAVCFILSACGGGGAVNVSVLERSRSADNMAFAGGLVKSVVGDDKFNLTVYSRISEMGQPITIYIEGDGFAYSSRSKVSKNPTPKNPVALQLATIDDSPNVVYIARPCQFSWGQGCESKYWTSARFAPEVIATVENVATQVLHSSKASNVKFVGFSGGGNIVAILASRFSNTSELITVAGNLNHEELNRHHRVSQLIDSLNASDIASKLANIPQLHLSGAKDATVPPFIAQNFITKVGGVCAKQKIIPSATHTKGWQGIWDEVLLIELGCE